MKRRNFMIGLGGAAIAGLPTTATCRRAPDRPGRSQKRTLFSTYVTNVDDVLGRGAIPVEAAAPVTLPRMPDRTYDPQSIAVETVRGVRLGYVPTNMGRILASNSGRGIAAGGIRHRYAQHSAAGYQDRNRNRGGRCRRTSEKPK